MLAAVAPQPPPTRATSGARKPCQGGARFPQRDKQSLSDFGGLAVYKCERWGVGSTSFVRHAYTCVKSGSYTKCFGKGGDPNADVYDPNNCKRIDEDSQCMDTCVSSEIDYGDKSYNLVCLCLVES